MPKLIITAAVCGSHPTKEMNPAVPYTPQEIAEEAIESWRAGAAIAHIHVRDPSTGAPAFDPSLFKEVVERIRTECDILINLTTSGLHLEGSEVIQRRLQPIDLHPELCSLDVGSLNFRNRVFVNSPEWSELASRRMLEEGVKPELEVFELGHIRQAIDLIDRGLVQEPAYFQLCMGVGWGIGGTTENLEFMRKKIPENAQWSVLGVGKSQRQMLAAGLRLGGHIRVGFEDNLYIQKGVLAASNAQFVEMAVEMAESMGREIASPDEAREILNI